MLKWAHYARKLDIGLLCPNMEIRPQAFKNGIFQNFFIFVERSPGFASNEPKHPQPPPDIKFKSVMQENVILAYYAEYGNLAPGSQNGIFQIFSFLWKGLQISLLTSPQPPLDIKLKSSYARKRDFGVLCPNMEIRPQAPKNEIFKKTFIFLKRSSNFASNEPSTTCRHKV